MGCGASRDGQSVHPADNTKKEKKEKKEETHPESPLKVQKEKKEKKNKEEGDTSDSSDDEGKKTSSHKPAVVFVLGGPGSGKGTQSEKIVKEYGFTHLSVGDLLRAEKASGSKTAKLIDEYISEGKLVPAKIAVKLIKKAMKKAGWEKSYYLVDGFPRNQDNLDAWKKIFKDSVDIKFTLYYDCSLETMEKRLLERAKTSGRSDDNPEAIKKRFITYQEETKPVIEHFEKQGLIRKINAERDVAEVYADTQAAINPIKDSLKAPEEKAKVFFVLGGPGSGKGTQCERIIVDFGLKHLSVGDLLRAETNSGSDLAKEIAGYMSQGQLVPSEVPVKLIKKAIESAPKGTNFLIDGFPRNQENITEWNKLVGNSVELKKILFFECSFETMEKRILERAKTSGRSDDNLEALKKRFDTYQKETAPVVEEYTKVSMITKINAEQEIDQVYAITKKTLHELLH